MNKCIYCRIEKENKDFSLEHVIPQFLGGSQSPDFLKTKDVCKKCNNDLGLFVDASFEKDFFVFNSINESAHAFYDSENPSALPLRCMGVSNYNPPEMHEDQICEIWLGPLGEHVFWIRPHDESLYWYSGGNPRTVKKVISAAYFLFSEKSKENMRLSLLSFKGAFEGRRVKKILCTSVDDLELFSKKMNFSLPDILDKQRIDYFNLEIRRTSRIKGRLTFYTRYDLRFLAKLSIGIAYCLFGKKALDAEYMNELHKVLWYREGEELPGIRGSSAFTKVNDKATKVVRESCGIKHATTITIWPLGEGIGINLNINVEHNWSVMCVERKDVDSNDLKVIGNGLSIVLFKPLKRCITMSLPELLAHTSGIKSNPDLTEINLLKRGCR